MAIPEVKIPKSILTQDPKDRSARQASEEADFEAAKRTYQQTASRFERYFADALTGEEMTAASKLARDFETRAKAGNAASSWDGISISSVVYGPKDGLADYLVYALERIHAAKAAIREGAPVTPYDLFALFERALMEDMTPSEVGAICARLARKQWQERRRREIGAEVIAQAARCIVPVFNRRVQKHA